MRLLCRRLPRLSPQPQPNLSLQGQSPARRQRPSSLTPVVALTPPMVLMALLPVTAALSVALLQALPAVPRVALSLTLDETPEALMAAAMLASVDDVAVPLTVAPWMALPYVAVP